MNIIVCMKQIPAEANAAFDSKQNMIRSKSAQTVGKEDYAALEAALKIKDKYQCNLYVMTLGPEFARSVLYEAIGKGADEGILITDASYAGSDTLASAKLLAKATGFLPKFDFIFLGNKSQDSATGNLVHQMAQILGICEVSHVLEVKNMDSLLEDDHIVVESLCDDLLIRTEVKKPAVLSFTKDSNHIRLTNMRLLSMAYSEDNIRVLNQESLEMNLEEVGVNGSKVKVTEHVIAKNEKKGIRFEADVDSSVDQMMQMLFKNPIFNKEIRL